MLSSNVASAKLAANMQAIGNFNALSRARQQVFYANAATSLTTSRHAALSAREGLIRALGLDSAQATSLKLPERLLDLPDNPISADEVSSVATDNRLDVRMGLADLRAASYAQGLSVFSEATDIEIAGISETVWREEERESANGFEVGIELPIFKSISKIRDQMNAKTLSAANRLENTTRSASSHLKEAYSGYRSGYDLASHYRYNGMIIGVFELLADSRAQIEAVQSSIQATRQFWIADAALRSSMVGKPMATTIAMSEGAGTSGGEEH